ncbi:MAG: haloacid dehalogenase type II [Proteobacteria bacterium]|nr:haloacid dehalogenase type II [Pseudomonadota bacterium]
MPIILDRRGFIVAAGAGIVATSISESTTADTLQASPGFDQRETALATVKACVFDTFGTVVDWRSSVIAEATEWGKARGLNINWVEFTDRWRLGYMPAMDKVRRGEIPWTPLDDLQRMILEDLLKQYRIEGLSEQEKIHWAHVWRRLKPWPDSVEGLTRLKRKYIISPMSNGNVALMTHLAKFAGLPWDLVLGSDLVQHYKPDREMYLSAPFYLDLKPEEVMMCAAHVGDLRAARNCGLRTAFIYRPHEYGDGLLGVPDKASLGDFDVVSESITDLAQHLGV